MKNCPNCAKEIQDEAIVCKHCGLDLRTKLAPRLPKRRRPKRNALIGLGFLVLSFIGVQIPPPTEDSAIFLPLVAVISLGANLALILFIVAIVQAIRNKLDHRASAKNEQALVRGSETSRGARPKTEGRMNCPVCAAGDVETTTAIIDRNTGTKVGVGSFLGGLAMVLVGGVLLVMGIFAWRSPVVRTQGNWGSFFVAGSVLFFSGLPMIITFFKREKVELASYVCISCQNQWNRLGGEEDSAALDAIVEALKNQNPNVRTEAGTVLANVKDARALEPLIDAVGDEVEGVRAAAVSALGGISDARSIDAILSALGDEEKSVRAAAAAALGHHRYPKIMAPLIAAMGDKKAIVRVKAGDALKEITGEKFVFQAQAEKWWHEKQESSRQ